MIQVMGNRAGLPRMRGLFYRNEYAATDQQKAGYPEK
jgi:hypothetical protein